MGRSNFFPQNYLFLKGVQNKFVSGRGQFFFIIIIYLFFGRGYMKKKIGDHEIVEPGAGADIPLWETGA